jgi:hypothetical protein
MFRFTIRDVLWLTVVVALVVAWWGDHIRLVRELKQTRRYSWEYFWQLRSAKIVPYGDEPGTAEPSP